MFLSFLGIEPHLPARSEVNTLTEVFRSKTILPKRSTKEVTKPTTETCLKPASPNTHYYNPFHVKKIQVGLSVSLKELKRALRWEVVRMAGTGSGSYPMAEFGTGAVRTSGFYRQETGYYNS
jgi:hypothetical protein